MHMSYVLLSRFLIVSSYYHREALPFSIFLYRFTISVTICHVIAQSFYNFITILHTLNAVFYLHDLTVK